MLGVSRQLTRLLSTPVLAAAVLLPGAAHGASGGFERAWGKGVGGGTGFEICTVSASCQAGFVGGLGGELRDPNDVAVDAAGEIYVSEGNNNRITKFDSSGNFLLTWGKDVLAGGGSGYEVCTVAADCKAGSRADWAESSLSPVALPLTRQGTSTSPTTSTTGSRSSMPRANSCSPGERT